MDLVKSIPVATATNIFDVLGELGIKPGVLSKPPVALNNYLKQSFTDEERVQLESDVERFAPKVEVMSFAGQKDIYFRTVGKSWATVFAVLPGSFVPVVGEYKHGCDQITLCLPSGVPNKDENGMEDEMAKYLACGKREFEEETGYRLQRIQPLTRHLLPVSGRQTTQSVLPCLAHVDTSIACGEPKLDANEKLKMVLVRLRDWIHIIQEGRGVEDCAVSTTFLALAELGLLGNSH